MLTCVFTLKNCLNWCQINPSITLHRSLKLKDTCRLLFSSSQGVYGLVFLSHTSWSVEWSDQSVAGGHWLCKQWHTLWTNVRTSTCTTQWHTRLHTMNKCTYINMYYTMTHTITHYEQMYVHQHVLHNDTHDHTLWTNVRTSTCTTQWHTWSHTMNKCTYINMYYTVTQHNKPFIFLACSATLLSPSLSAVRLMGDNTPLWSRDCATIRANCNRTIMMDN